MDRKPRLDRIDSTTSAETTDTSPARSSAPSEASGSSAPSRDGGAAGSVRKRGGGRGRSSSFATQHSDDTAKRGGGRGRSSSSSATQHSDDVATDDAYQYKSRRGEVFKRLLDVIGTAQCSPARSRLWDAVKVLSRIVEDVKTLDADATDDDVRHHLDRLQRAINREYNSGQVPVVFCLVLMCFVHCSAARQVKMHTARAQYLMESMRRKGSTTSQGSSLSSESGRPRSSRHSSGGRSGSGRSSDASSERRREVRIGADRRPNEIAVDRAQLSAAELAEEIAREKDAARARLSGPTVGAEVSRAPFGIPAVGRSRRLLPDPPRPSSSTTTGSRESTRTLRLPAATAASSSRTTRTTSPRTRTSWSARRSSPARPRSATLSPCTAIAASVGHAHEPPDYGPKASETLRLRAHTWRDFDMFAFADDIGPERCGERGGGPLMALGVAILDRHGVFERLGVERDSCAAFLAGLHCLYMRRGGMYHGPMHAADVLQAAGVLLDLALALAPRGRDAGDARFGAARITEPTATHREEEGRAWTTCRRSRS